ncbi:MAG TPA: phosphoribosylaminoimidazolesuccinocarboxamide synthase [Thermoleophilia bacterium]|nr:phosphoribosylaminoimidazolesuccinocarboxamide synthase [Thermoleophilia bacterium]
MTSTAMFASQERGLAIYRRGKVRDVYRPSDEHLIIVACDRISAFDHVLPTPIPDKGPILTRMSNFWFAKTEHLIANHIVDPDPGPEWYPELDWYYDDLEGRTVLVRYAKPLSIEAIVRGYLSGSGWKEYQKMGTVCSIPLPEGLGESARLPEPLFTPSTKAHSGHDENISFERAAALVGRETAQRVREASRALYGFAADYALDRGIIIADTKFEFGLTEEGELLLIDEIFTPDSSRFWPADSYEPGRPQASFDKQFVRDYLESIRWNKEAPAPPLPADIVQQTRGKYLEALRRLLS